MRHMRGGFKLGRDVSHRKALLRILVTSVIEHERVVTTPTKAKAVRPIVVKIEATSGNATFRSASMGWNSGTPGVPVSLTFS